MYLVDASVWVSLVERDSPHREAAASLVRNCRLAALDLTLYEIGNAVGVKQGDATEAGRIVSLLLRCCRDHLLAIDAELLDAALRLAAEHGLTAYDAAYVAAAQRNGWTLVSADIADLVSKGLAVAPDAAVYP
ncbi:MAG TPA: PIN domain-containing protein [Solirubrobacterales bacterium]|jgi:predicted nucleic acid-binding protein|nr:PIN domain-containing protein [Solirubrobacterales bacterium]